MLQQIRDLKKNHNLLLVMENPLYGKVAEVYVERDHPVWNDSVTSSMVGKYIWTISLWLISSFLCIIFAFRLSHMAQNEADKSCGSGNVAHVGGVNVYNVLLWMACVTSVISMFLAAIMTIRYSWTWRTTFHGKRTPLLPFAHDIEDESATFGGPYTLENRGNMLDLDMLRLRGEVHLNATKGDFIIDEEYNGDEYQNTVTTQENMV